MIPKNIDEQSPPFSYVHSDSLYRLLVENGISLLLTTYEAGKILLVRAGENQKLSLLLRHFEQPMGVAIDDFRLAIGGLTQIWEFHNAPEIGTQLDGNEEYDACFVPRCSHVTGDIRIHEMTWVDYNLVFVNTRFSCLSTIDRRYSFLPIWKPSFISCISAEDRCHLNGMADETGKIRYVTSLGKTDQQKGWRASKVDGGIIIDVSSHEIVSNGLSMPHSPRIYQGCLWVLNSGRGELQKVDITTGKRETLVRLPGFLRGLDFFG